ncbi:hypothetical protein BH09BAC3_BH09BAC3_14950 [soil metagenome]
MVYRNAYVFYVAMWLKDSLAATLRVFYRRDAKAQRTAEEFALTELSLKAQVGLPYAYVFYVPMWLKDSLAATLLVFHRKDAKTQRREGAEDRGE